MRKTKKRVTAATNSIVTSHAAATRCGDDSVLAGLASVGHSPTARCSRAGGPDPHSLGWAIRRARSSSCGGGSRVGK